MRTKEQGMHLTLNKHDDDDDDDKIYATSGDRKSSLSQTQV